MAHDPTDEQLLAAWHRLRRPDWGTATFANDKAAALRWALVRLEAQHPRGTRHLPPPRQEPEHAKQPPPQPRAADPQPTAAPTHQAPRRSPQRISEPAAYDRKRAAAGDRDDDDAPRLF